MKFNSARSHAQSWLGLAPDMTAYQGTFNPTEGINAVENANSLKSQAEMNQMGVIGTALTRANEIIEVGKYNTDLAAAQNAMQASNTRQQGMMNMINGIAGGIAGGIPTGGGTGATEYGLGGGVGQGVLNAPVSTGDNAISLINSWNNYQVP